MKHDCALDFNILDIEKKSEWVATYIVQLMYMGDIKK